MTIPAIVANSRGRSPVLVGLAGATRWPVLDVPALSRGRMAGKMVGRMNQQNTVPPEWMEALFRRFESAWHEGPRPSIDSYLPSIGPERLAALKEPSRMDLQSRVMAGDAARVEEYLQRYPSLASDPAAVLTLIVWECKSRQRRESSLSLNEYRLRFPQFREELAAQLSTILLCSPGSGHGRARSFPSQDFFRAAERAARFRRESFTAT